MTDEKEKNEAESQQSHRRKSIEEQASEIGDVKLSPMAVIVVGAIICIGLLVALIVVVPNMMGNDDDISKFVTKTDEDNTNKDGEKDNKPVKPAPKGDYIIVKAPENPKVKIKTNMGDITVELFEDKAPNSVANFIELCQKKFYNDIRFHRIIKDFMIQGGCPNARGQIGPRAGGGDAGYKLKDEIWSGQTFSNEAGLLAWANGGANTSTNGSQFFITHKKLDRPDLDIAHTILGKVIDGMGVVNEIATMRTQPNDQPIDDVYIISTEILQIRDHVYEAEKIYR